MKTIDEIKGRCVITEDGHWLWKGAIRPDGRAHIYAPDFTRRDGALSTQSGPRAVWHCANQKPVPSGWRVFGNCDEPTCCNPNHILLMSEKDFGKRQQRAGTLKGQTARILANRAIGRQRAVLTPEQVLYVQTSPKLGIDLAAELNVSKSAISKYRRGEFVCVRAAGGMFSGLMGGARG
ncbi:hypothetical protein G7048_22695 [Diaphorobacter sp. HDW4B]|uniref:hypothetical protein n=1 Tax=Diaphorobacter sp. HDW4B TaxID=2714925 RepID=UPI00140D679F|nr:hypothetical protein [Diaphorobacter sp. HDW4B]QIL72910.1 hypothetical protein G7048_22695 [Diaphorobacter sp. HDW4B]